MFASLIVTEEVLNVSTGSDLESAIQNASDGDWIKLSSGTYTISNWLTLDGVTGVRIVGEGPEATTIKVADGANVDGFWVGNTSPVTGLLIADLAVDGNRANQTADLTDKHKLHGIELADVDKAHIHNVEVRDTYPNASEGDPYGGSDSSGTVNAANGIWARGACTDVTVTESTTIHTGYDGITLCGERMQIVDCIAYGQSNRGLSASERHPNNGARHMIIANSLAEGGDFPGSGASAIGVSEGAEHVSVTGNTTFYRSSRNNKARRGIAVTRSVDKVVVVGNEIFAQNNNTAGITVESGSWGVLVSGNYIYGGGASIIGIQVTKGAAVAVVGNQVRDFAGRAITLKGSNPEAIVANNLCSDVDSGILASGRSRAKITGNQIKTLSPTGANVIEVQSSASKISVVDNDVRMNNSNYDGIFFDADGVVRGNYIYGGDANYGVEVGSDAGNVYYWGNYIDPAITVTAEYSIKASNRWNGEVKASGTASAPSSTGKVGIINYTDTDGGAGTGIYYEDRDGSVHGPI